MVKACFEKAAVLLDLIVDATALEKICDRQLTSMANV
jgi:hypothetical protein